MMKKTTAIAAALLLSSIYVTPTIAMVMHGNAGAAPGTNALTHLNTSGDTALVAAGCASEPTSWGHTYYMAGGSGGSAANNGLSPATPWRNLYHSIHDDNKFATDPAETGGVVTSGDRVLLLTGAQGDPTNNEVNMGASWTQTSHITIAAAPSNTPTLLQIQGQNMPFLAIHGLTMGGTIPGAAGGLFYTMLFTGTSANHDLILSGNTISSMSIAALRALNTSARNAHGSDNGLATIDSSFISGIEVVGTNDSCLAFTDDTIFNVKNGIVQGPTLSSTVRPDHVLVARNTVNIYVNDGIDYEANDYLQEDNVVTNAIIDGDGDHPDCGQRQVAGGSSTPLFVNIDSIVIKYNTCVGVADLTLPYLGDTQGFNSFDGTESNVYVGYNVVINNLQDALYYAGVNHGHFEHNVIGGDQGFGLECDVANISACQTAWNTTAATDFRDQPPLLMITDSKASVASNDIQLNDNWGSSFTIDKNTTNWTSARMHSWFTVNTANHIWAEWFTTPGGTDNFKTAAGYYSAVDATVEGNAAGAPYLTSGAICNQGTGKWCLPDDVDLKTYTVGTLGTGTPTYDLRLKSGAQP